MPKSLKNVDCNKCFFKCSNSFTDEDHQQICKEYQAAPYDRQKDFILSRVPQCNIERRRIRNELLCNKFFLSTLCVSNGPLKTAFTHKSEASGTFVGTDQRDHKTPPNKTSEYWTAKIRLT
ncbi:hypothetical protein PR048_029986 [Dryococelus australis]|uniref:Uncharacterized protein n=1 Tax=Dryococelus australis TaxID=614101 RepID=A0ABQ9G855_9NEOP|nr:hypothetical protein PR048_029986 [Dryococelus australis]